VKWWGIEKIKGPWQDVLMQNSTPEPMDPSKAFCPNAMCSARGQRGLGNIVIHDRKRQRYRCKACKKTFSARRGTMFEGLRKPVDLIVIVVTLLTYGCPVQAIVHAFGLDERTVADWRDRAGAHCHKVHQEIIEQGQLDLMHVQADAHSGERMQDDRLDGIGHDGFDALVDSRRGPALARSQPG
jgi:transposase-like protein